MMWEVRCVLDSLNAKPLMLSQPAKKKLGGHQPVGPIPIRLLITFNTHRYLPALAATNFASTAFQLTTFHQASM